MGSSVPAEHGGLQPWGQRVVVSAPVPLWTAGGVWGSGVLGVVFSSRRLFQAGDPSLGGDSAAEGDLAPMGPVCVWGGGQCSLIPLPSPERRRRS